MFEAIHGPRGLRLALVFGNEAPFGKCPFHENQCKHCDLGAGEGRQFTPDLNHQRLDFFAQHYQNVFPKVQHLVIYNSGSTLDPHELSDETLGNILRFASSLPKCTRISFDSRETFVKKERIEWLQQRLKSDQTVCLTLGMESQDDAIRLGKLAKHMPKEQISKVFQVFSGIKQPRGIEINLVFQAPEILGKSAVEEVLASVTYGLDLMKKFDVPVDFNFHPYYPSVKGLTEFPNHPRAILQDGIKALIASVRLIKQRNLDSKIFVGWNDEGHDQENLLRNRELEIYLPGILRFNQSQNEADLRV